MLPRRHIDPWPMEVPHIALIRYSQRLTLKFGTSMDETAPHLSMREKARRIGEAMEARLERLASQASVSGKGKHWLVDVARAHLKLQHWTPADINRLPPRLREYIHDLETRTGPAGDVRTIAILREQLEELETAYAKLKARRGGR